jgi:hypothetical protein
LIGPRWRWNEAALVRFLESKKLGIREVALERPPGDVAARGGAGGGL